MNSQEKLRFCPSPTGLMHLGNTRTALFNALYAKKQQGIFLLRIEDTDKERSKEEYTDQVQQDLLWLGLDWDEGPQKDKGNGPYWQSQRQAIYDHYYERLSTNGSAYPCFCSEEQLAIARKIQRSQGKPPRYPGTCRLLSSTEIDKKIAEGLKPTLRFRVPKGELIEFNDYVKGVQRFQSDDIGDFIIRRADKTAPFMYCNAIDDGLMGVTHVLRGEDHLTNTPRQILIFKALGLNMPQYGHISLIVGADGSPLSKRHGSRSVKALREEGFFPLAINNYLARLGHSYENQQLMLLAELAEQFEVHQLSRSSARFDVNQLHYWQNEVIAKADWETLWTWVGEKVQSLIPHSKRQQFIETIRPNVTFPKDAFKWAVILFNEAFHYQEHHLDIIQEAGKDFFEAAYAVVINNDEANFAVISQAVKDKTAKKGKALFQPLRVALTGELHGPEMVQIVSLLGSDTIIKRLKHALTFFNA